jgi:hypothetical protein
MLSESRGRKLDCGTVKLAKFFHDDVQRMSETGLAPDNLYDISMAFRQFCSCHVRRNEAWNSLAKKYRNGAATSGCLCFLRVSL